MSERTLTYQLSQELSKDEIEQVSGAGHPTSTPTVAGSVDSTGHLDSSLDINWDF